MKSKAGAQGFLHGFVRESLRSGMPNQTYEAAEALRPSGINQSSNSWKQPTSNNIERGSRGNGNVKAVMPNADYEIIIILGPLGLFAAKRGIEYYISLIFSSNSEQISW